MTPRTRKQVEAHPAVDRVDYEPTEDAKWWIYLKDGHSAAADPGNIHQGNGRTLKEAIDDVFPVHPCGCSEPCRKANPLLGATSRGSIFPKPKEGNEKCEF